MESSPEDVIHVTGFGVFRGFAKTNPSWEAVSLLPDSIEYKGRRFDIVKHEVPVTYAAVDQKVQEIWSSKPKLVIHCGVHQKAEKIHLEKNAFNGRFEEADFSNRKLNCCNITLQNSGEECKQLCTKFDLTKIVKVTDANAINVSYHPGDYLCGYIYLKSLDMDQSRALFIHVPAPRDDFTIQKISDGIHSVIGQCIEQLENRQ